MQVTNLNGAIKKITVGGTDYSLTGSSFMGSTAEWASSSYVPQHGEIVIYNDNGDIQFKIGDGTKTVGNLTFVEMGEDVDLTGYLKSNNMTITDLAAIEGSGVKFSFPSNTSNQLTVANISSWNASSISLFGTAAVSASAPMVSISATGLNGNLTLNSGATATLKGGDVNIESTVTKTTISGPEVSLLAKAGSTTGPSINLDATTGAMTFNGQVSVSGRMSNLDESAATPGTYVPQTYEYVTKKYVDDTVASSGGGGSGTSYISRSTVESCFILGTEVM